MVYDQVVPLERIVLTAKEAGARLVVSYIRSRLHLGVSLFLKEGIERGNRYLVPAARVSRLD